MLDHQEKLYPGFYGHLRSVWSMSDEFFGLQNTMSINYCLSNSASQTIHNLVAQNSGYLFLGHTPADWLGSTDLG